MRTENRFTIIQSSSWTLPLVKLDSPVSFHRVAQHIKTGAELNLTTSTNTLKFRFVFLCLSRLIQDFVDDGGEGVVLEGFVAWELAVEIAAEDRVTRERFEEVLAE